jgi:hypothetical protein
MPNKKSTNAQAKNSKIRKKSARPSKDQGRMYCRRGDLIRLGHYCAEHNIEIATEKWVAVIADCLSFGHGRPDWYHVLEFASRCAITLDEGDDGAYCAFRAVHDKAEARGPLYRPFADRAIGNMLHVDLATKLAARLTTIRAYDETTEAELARRKETKRRRDRDRQRAKRAALTPRAEYEANSLSRTKPWHALNMSRPKFYRLGLHLAADGMNPREPSRPFAKCETSASPALLIKTVSNRLVSPEKTATTKDSKKTNSSAPRASVVPPEGRNTGPAIRRSTYSAEEVQLVLETMDGWPMTLAGIVARTNQYGEGRDGESSGVTGAQVANMVRHDLFYRCDKNSNSDPKGKYLCAARVSAMPPKAEAKGKAREPALRAAPGGAPSVLRVTDRKSAYENDDIRMAMETLDNPITVGAIVNRSRQFGQIGVTSAQVKHMLRDGLLFTCDINGYPDPHGKYLFDSAWLRKAA